MVLRFYGCRVLLLVIKGLISVKQLHAQSKPCGPWRLKTQAMKMSEAILEKKAAGNPTPCDILHPAPSASLGHKLCFKLSAKSVLKIKKQKKNKTMAISASPGGRGSTGPLGVKALINQWSLDGKA